MKQILKVIVGSQAHGLATPESDYDYRGVFINPTSDILKLGGDIKHTSWIEGKDDDTSWELGHFLHLATKCNPTILETFLAPTCELPLPMYGDRWSQDLQIERIQLAEYGRQLRELFPYVWNSRDVMNAFIGYGLNQRKKFLEDKDKRAPKFAAAYLRSLYNAYELLSTGTFTIRVADTEIGEKVRAFKYGEYTVGEVMQICWDWEQKVRQAYERNPNKDTDLQKVNDYLLSVRKNNW